MTPHSWDISGFPSWKWSCHHPLNYRPLLLNYYIRLHFLMVLGHVSSPFLDGKLIQQTACFGYHCVPQEGQHLTLTVLKTTGRISLCMGHTARFTKPSAKWGHGALCLKSIKNFQVGTVGHSSKLGRLHSMEPYAAAQVAHSWGQPHRCLTEWMNPSISLTKAMVFSCLVMAQVLKQTGRRRRKQPD